MPWNDAARSTGRAPTAPGVRAGERLRHDHLRRREGRVPLREAGGIREAGRAEVRVGLVDPVVDDADLDPCAGRARRRLQRVRADQAGARVAGQGVAQRRVDVRHSCDANEPGQPLGRERDGQPVEQDPEATADARLGNRPVQPRDGDSLLLVDPLQVRARGGARDVQVARASARLRRPSPGGRERGQLQVDDHAHASARLPCGDLDRAGPEPRHRHAVDGPAHRGQPGRGCGCEGERRDERKGDDEAAQETQCSWKDIDSRP